MKKAILCCIILTISCSEFLEISPKGSLSEADLSTKERVESLLIGTYALLDGSGNNIGMFESAASNWIYGSITGGDAHTGSQPADGPVPLIKEFELYTPTLDNSFLNDRWRSIYEGVSRANAVLRAVEDMEDEGKNRIRAEARVLRGIFHFEAIKMWRLVPYIGENDDGMRVKNDKLIWSEIESDIRFGYENLPEVMDAIGRINKWIAGALLGKALLFQQEYGKAKPVLEDVYQNGKNPEGTKFNLLSHFFDNFNVTNEKNSEAVFSFQYSVKDGASGANGNMADILNSPNYAPLGLCCGFFQPSSELVNSYRTSAQGLPLLGGSYNDDDNAVKDDEDYESSDDSFVPDSGYLDPRLDWTVTRRGISYLDWGVNPGKDWWEREDGDGGPYNSKKQAIYQSQLANFTEPSWSNITAKNFVVIRFADIILWLAECEVEVGSLDKARDYVNMIRERASNPAGFVMKEDGVTPSANYFINTYPLSGFPFDTNENARKAVRFERKLELAMEGHRFFDLVRWDEATETINAYLNYEKNKRTYLKDADFDEGIDEYYPIPQQQIDLTGADILKQNR